MFLSSHYNSPGWVVLRLFPHVTSTAMKRWRSERNRDGGGLVAGAGTAMHTKTGMLFAKALALAVVEVVEGHTRALRHERRKFS